MVQPLSQRATSVLASAYELGRWQVEDDALYLQQWTGSEAELVSSIQRRHGWTAASEYAPYYVADLRQALQLRSFSNNGVSH